MTRLIVRTTDTDVFVPAVADAKKIPAVEIWVPFGVGKNFSYIPAHQIASQLGPRPASVLSMLHVITGCGTVFFYAGNEKSRAWTVGKLTPRLHAHSCLSPMDLMC